MYNYICMNVCVYICVCINSKKDRTEAPQIKMELSIRRPIYTCAAVTMHVHFHYALSKCVADIFIPFRCDSLSIFDAHSASVQSRKQQIHDLKRLLLVTLRFASTDKEFSSHNNSLTYRRTPVTMRTASPVST